MGKDLFIYWWCGNIWFDGLFVWEEFDWVGCDLCLGEVVVSVCECIECCMVIILNFDIGECDVDILGVL